MRSSRAVSDGSRRMISAICEDMLESEFTSSRRAWLIRPNEASLGQALMRLEMKVHEIAALFGLKPEDLNLELGPLGNLLDK